MKTVLITGANKGIGREVAHQLATREFHVFIGARNAKEGRTAAQDLAKEGGKTTFLEIDVSDDASVKAAAREFARQSDHLDVLVNNAGIIVDGDDGILKINDDILRRAIETNTLGALRVTRAFGALLSKSKKPRVINVSSGGGRLTDGADGWAPAYCISKTALNGVTSQLAAALPKFAINSVCPGWVRTDMGGANASRSVEQGADTIIWLATDAPQNLSGKFFRDRKEIRWRRWKPAGLPDSAWAVCVMFVSA
jgi:NAD(P)-dependent dehydrogenase (short-subunit alcohol dehydrogenase family)